MNNNRTKEQSVYETDTPNNPDENNNGLVDKHSSTDSKKIVKRSKASAKLTEEVRRDMVFELSVKGYTQTEIANQLGVSQPTVHRDLQDAKTQFCSTRERFYDIIVEQTLKTVSGTDLISKQLWQMLEDKKTSNQHRLTAASLLMKLNASRTQPIAGTKKNAPLENVRNKAWMEQEGIILPSI